MAPVGTSGTLSRRDGAANRQHTGRRGEDLACAYLETHGYQILERNWRSRSGELDIVARRGSTVVVVEVKTRRGYGYGTPLESITRVKLLRLRRLFGEWLLAREVNATRLRIDAIGVVLFRGSPPEIVHIEGVV